MLNLTECRDRIDSVDNQILELLKQRKEIADDIANYKLERDQPVSDKNREQQKLNTLMLPKWDLRRLLLTKFSAKL